MTRHTPGLLALIITAALVHPACGIDLLYDFEGDSGDTATDKLPAGGLQNGTLLGNVSIQGPGGVPFGNFAALFEAPDPFSPPFSTIEIPGTTALGNAYTLALHASLAEADPSRTRVFSSYPGSGGVGSDVLLFDFDPGVGMRAFVGGEAISTPDIPTGLGDPGYHHYAMTVNNGDVRLYFDGAEVGSGFVVSAFSNSENVLIGEDRGGTSNEQLIGNIDDVLAIDQALSASDIMTLASGSSVQSVVTPAGSLAVNYDFEGDSGTMFSDKFGADGVQDGIATLDAMIDSNAANALLGTGSAVLADAAAGRSRFSQIATNVTGTDLGDQFTVSAVINVPEGGGFASGGLARLFSTYSGGGSPAGRFLLDFNPDADVASIGVRLILPDGTTLTSNDTFATGVDHTITAVYDLGDVRLYMDGNEIAPPGSTSGVVDLGEFSLMVGEDLGGSINENFIGTMDDVLILSRALSPAQVERLSRLGAAAVPEPASLATASFAALAAAGALRRRRRSAGRLS